MLYPQHSDSIVTTDYVASLRSMYTLQWTGTCPLAKVFLRDVGFGTLSSTVFLESCTHESHTKLRLDRFSRFRTTHVRVVL